MWEDWFNYRFILLYFRIIRFLIKVLGRVCLEYHYIFSYTSVTHICLHFCIIVGRAMLLNNYNNYLIHSRAFIFLNLCCYGQKVKVVSCLLLGARLPSLVTLYTKKKLPYNFKNSKYYIIKSLVQNYEILYENVFYVCTSIITLGKSQPKICCNWVKA